MNKRLAITAQKAIGKGQLLWLDCYNNSIFDEVSPTLKTTTKSSEMNFIMEQGKQDYKQIPQQKYPTMTTDQHLNVITLFSGYDSQALALNRLGLPYDLAAWCEIDRHAITAHNALFPQWKDRNLGDVSKVDWAEWHASHPQPIDLLTYSSPCQDFSSAGLQRGGEEGSGTRSGLLWETERAVRELRPRHLVFENVGGLVSDKFIDLFNRWQARLNTYGYTNFQQLMNAKDYGVPQNRLRIFMVSILDCQRAYYFPKPFKLERRLKDVLEQNVEERYYLSEERVKKLVSETEIHADRGNGFAFRPHTPEEIASTVKCSGIGDKTDNFIAEPTIYGLPHGHYEGDLYTEYAPTVKCSVMQAQHFVSTGIRIRRLTERELYRLMDVEEKDIDTLLSAPISRTQHAKLAGNSIVVACLYHIFRHLFVTTDPTPGTQTKLF